MKFWRTIAVFFGGIITGFLIFTKIKKPGTVIHADTYINEQMQKIGKIKQKGQGNQQEVEVVLRVPTKEELRKSKQTSRKAKRISRKSQG